MSISNIDVLKRIQRSLIRLRLNNRIGKISRNVAGNSRYSPGQQPIVIFNASTRLGGLSQNAAFSMLVSWSLQLAGIPIIHFVCKSGMSRCVLGTNPDKYDQPPPCKLCIEQSNRLHASAPVHKFSFTPEKMLLSAIEELSLPELLKLEYPLKPTGKLIPLGKIILPSLRWTLRKHNIADNESTRKLCKEFVLSAFNVSCAFHEFLRNTNPLVVLVFNGLQFPEAVVKWVAEQKNIRVITHEVGFQPYSAFFSEKEATAYPIDFPDNFQLSPEQNERLDRYLSKRFRGDFTMAGIKFWPDIVKLDKPLLNQILEYSQVVTIFSNVIFDTSQIHANKLFVDMFAWLESLLELFHSYPDTLFIIRAHPDEKRSGTRKISRESVSDWVARKGLKDISNVIFYDSNDYVNSYELIRKSKFVLVYNSSIGLEAVLLGVSVLSGGLARYSQYPIVEMPKSINAYKQRVAELLMGSEVEVLAEHRCNARRFLYYQLFRVSIPFDEFISSYPTPGYVQIKRFRWHQLYANKSESIRVIHDGIIQNKSFILPEE